jgi:DNA modification methylase
MAFEIHHGDCREVMATLDAESVDSIVCDPPYGLSFMGKGWDHGVPGVEFWTEALRVAKPGAHLMAFGGTRTYHRLACAIEDAGWEIRDLIAWISNKTFPKSLDVSKAIDKMDAAQEQEERRYRFTAWVRSTGVTARQIDEATRTNMGGHYTTAASQPAIMTREHLEACRHLLGDVPEWVERESDIRSVESKTFAQRKAVGAARYVPDASVTRPHFAAIAGDGSAFREYFDTTPATDAAHKWHGWGTALKPVVEPIVMARKPLVGTVADNVTTHGTGAINVNGCRVEGGRWPANVMHDGSEEATASMGEAARFFYCARASKADRGDGNHHPTVKPTDLMRYLCRLVTPPGGVVLDPFTGSGSTGKGAVLEGFRFVGIEREAEYVGIAKKRIAAAAGEQPSPPEKRPEPPLDDLPLFRNLGPAA